MSRASPLLEASGRCFSCLFDVFSHLMKLLHEGANAFAVLIFIMPFFVAVKSVESKTESFGGADREGEDPEQQRLLLQTACGTGQTQTSHIQGDQLIIHYCT